MLQIHKNEQTRFWNVNYRPAFLSHILNNKEAFYTTPNMSRPLSMLTKKHAHTHAQKALFVLSFFLWELFLRMFCLFPSAMFLRLQYYWFFCRAQKLYWPFSPEKKYIYFITVNVIFCNQKSFKYLLVLLQIVSFKF